MAEEKEEKKDSKKEEEDDKDEEKEEKTKEKEKKDDRPQYKPKQGDYQIQVHIIEGRDLKGRGWGGMSDPVVEIECFEKTKVTSIKKSVLNCTWDEVIYFEMKNMEPARLEAEKIKIRVMDANTFTRNVMIGAYELDLSFVYYRKDHEVYRQWLALTDVSDPSHEGVQGYLRISAVCLGPDDELKIHDEAEDDDEEMTVLVPPHIEQKGMLMTAQIWSALDLPQMDDFSLTSSTRCDPFLEIEFASFKSRTKELKGQNVKFNEALAIPVMEPAMSDNIKITAWDADIAMKPDLIGTALLKYSKIKSFPDNKTPPFWINFYGSPEGHNKGAVAEKMNKGTMEGTQFRGRILCAFDVKAMDNPLPSVTTIGELPAEQLPKTINWCVQVDLYEAIEVPLSGNWVIEVTCGLTVYTSVESPEKNGIVEWFSAVKNKKDSNLIFTFPEDVDQVPDIIIYLRRKKLNSQRRISYYRIPFRDALTKWGFKSSPRWITMKEDKVHDKLDETQFPGMILLGLRCGKATEVPEKLAPTCRPFLSGIVAPEEHVDPTVVVVDPDAEADESRTRAKVVERVGSAKDYSAFASSFGSLKLTIIKGKDLPIMDRSGSSDPFVRVKLPGKKDWDTSIKKANLNPVWNEVLDLGDVPFVSEVTFEVYDYDFGRPNELMGSFVVHLPSICPEPGKDFAKEEWRLIGSSDKPNAQIQVKFEFKFHAAAKSESLKKAAIDAAEAKDKAPLKAMASFTRLITGKAEEKVGGIFGGGKGEDFFGKPTMIQYQLRAHIYQCRQLAGLDQSGLSDPFIIVRCAGNWDQTQVRNQTNNPVYYDTLTLSVNLPTPLSLAPDIVVTVLDKDLIGKPDLIGRFSVPITKALETSTSHFLENLDPEWYDLYDVDGNKAEGQVLACFQVLTVEVATTLAPPVLKPKAKTMYLEVSTLGLRGLNSTFGLNKPRIEFELPNGKRFMTDPSRVPTPRNPNFLQVLKIPVKVPENPMFAPALTVEVRDIWFGGFLKRQIGTSSLLLEKFMQAMHVDNWNVETKMALLDETDLLNEIAVLETSKKVRRLSDAKATPAVDAAVADAEEKKEEKKEEEEAKEEKKVEEDEEEPHLEDEKAPLLLDVEKETYDDAIVCQWDEKVSRGDDEKPHYRKGRDEIKDELEDFIRIKPFDEIDVYTGKKNTRSHRKVGMFKGLIRVTKEKDAPGGIDTKDLLAPKDVFVRLYVLNGKNLTPMDADGASDPYLVVTLGNTKISLRDRYHSDTRDPKFYESFEIPCTIPGASELKIDVYDWDGIGDDLIGSTVIDVEDRWFSKEWRGMKKKPIEWRTLRNPTCSNGQGFLELWVDILNTGDAKKYPMVNIAPPPVIDYELRFIAWQCKDVTIKDEITQQNDLYITGRLDVGNAKKQRTDTHFRSKKGVGSFNWRMIYPIQLPQNDVRFSIQIWDMDFFSANDSICEAYLSLKNLCRKAYKVRDRVKMMKDGSDKIWIENLRHPNEGDKNQGKVQVSFEIMPVTVAAQLPAGLGRGEPNMNPVLPPPEGRLQWLNLLMNPYKLLQEILGEQLFRKVCLGFFCIVIFALVIFLAPNLLSNIFVKLVIG